MAGVLQVRIRKKNERLVGLTGYVACTRDMRVAREPARPAESFGRSAGTKRFPKRIGFLFVRHAFLQKSPCSFLKSTRSTTGIK